VHEALSIEEAEPVQRMSDGILDQNKNQSPDSPATGEKKESSRKSAMGGLRPDLKSALSQALDSWETVTEQVINKQSPDQKQLEDVKRLLSELKSKINQFED